MMSVVIFGLIIPFIGTLIGAACVYLLRNDLKVYVQKILISFAAGVMLGASMFSLLIPSLKQANHFMNSIFGLMLGMGFIWLLDMIIPHIHYFSNAKEGMKVNLSRSVMMLLAMTLHNIPEGMAVGILFSAVLQGETMLLQDALVLAIGIAVQNFPEGAIVSLPLRKEGLSKNQAFLWGAISGVCELLASIFTVFVTQNVNMFMPYLLSFAAGAMIYVVVEELIPEASSGKHSNLMTLVFGLGLMVMIVLKYGLG